MGFIPGKILALYKYNMQKNSSKNEVESRPKPSNSSNVFNNSFKSPLNLYESNVQTRKVSRAEGTSRQVSGRPNIYQSDVLANKSVEKLPKPKKAEVPIGQKPKPVQLKSRPEIILKPEVALISKYNSKNSYNQAKVGSTTQISSQMMSPSAQDRFENTTDSLKNELQFINKGIQPVRIFEDSGKGLNEGKKRTNPNLVPKPYYSEKDKEFLPEGSDVRLKMALKRNPSNVKVMGSPNKVAKKSPSPPPRHSRSSSASSDSNNHSRSFVDARQIKKQFLQNVGPKNGRKRSPKKMNSSVPTNKNIVHNEEFENKINATNFNMSGHIDPTTGPNNSGPIKKELISREHIFKIKEDKDMSDLISYIKHNFVDYPNQRFKTSLNFYELLKILGKGTYGKVYEAQHKLTSCKVAIKCIEKTTIKNEKSMQKIFNEVEILANLNYSNIIKLFEIFENDKYYFFVTEFAEKGDLLRLIENNGSFNEVQSFLILKDLVESLKYLHSKGILHRDVKLDNILLNNKYKVKLCDFGISLKINEGSKLTEKCGTPAYMAPEIITGSYSGFGVDVS
jgi:tRNA A-37 threonylcarbamoyl transferase component Bud32